MNVVKRNGERQQVVFDKITKRLTYLCNFPTTLDKLVNTTKIAQTVVGGLYDGVTTRELDVFASEVAATMSSDHPDYGILASRIIISNLHKNTKNSFTETVGLCFESRLVNEQFAQIVFNHGKIFDQWIDYSYDYLFDYFAIKTFERSYLLKIDDKVVERPQDLFMRVAIGIHGTDLEKVYKTFNFTRCKYFTHATPTLFNAGTNIPQLSSCFLLDIENDSINGIFKTLGNVAKISQYAGGVGLSIHKIRATGAKIAGTNGVSSGIVPMLKVFNDTARYVNQAGKRKGSVAIYIEPWHADIFEFLELKKNTGLEDFKARDLFYALWIPDLFMKRVIANEQWALLSPNDCNELQELYGLDFEREYCRYETTATKIVPARTLWEKIITCQIETGTPYMLYKDACNAKSNQQNLGTIKSSNLCAEIVEYTDNNEIAVCNLASICLPKFVENGLVNHDLLFQVVVHVVENLNKIIDCTVYPVEEARYSNLKHRPIGIGIQGLADVFAIMRIAFDSVEAKKINTDIAETIYFAALYSSHQLALQFGKYSSFVGSPLSVGKFQFDLWNIQPSTRWNWDTLRQNIIKDGVRNSLVTAYMPTVSTCQLMGNNESFEPFPSNLYVKRSLSGEFIIINKYLLHDLCKLNLWNQDLKQELIRNNGSVQLLDIPQELKNLYKTVWEIKTRTLIDMAIDRAPFIDQSQSMNLYISDPTTSKLSSIHKYTWENGLKTGMYYLRTKSAVNAVQVTIDPCTSCVS